MKELSHWSSQYVMTSWELIGCHTRVGSPRAVSPSSMPTKASSASESCPSGKGKGPPPPAPHHQLLDPPHPLGGRGQPGHAPLEQRPQLRLTGGLRAARPPAAVPAIGPGVGPAVGAGEVVAGPDATEHRDPETTEPVLEHVDHRPAPVLDVTEPVERAEGDAAHAVEGTGTSLEHTTRVDVRAPVERWLAQASTPPDVADAIRAELRDELTGGPSTGMRPVDDGELQYTQTWEIAVARVPSS